MNRSNPSLPASMPSIDPLYKAIAAFRSTPRPHGLLALGLVLSSATACGGGRQYSPPTAASAKAASIVVPASAFEGAVLAQLSQAVPEQVVTGDDGAATVHGSYHAANGRTCRAVTFQVTEQAAERLACHDGSAWFFVPSLAHDPGAFPASSATPGQALAVGQGEQP